ncbi:myosin-11 [Cocos nucifera]|uniref:Myosin-11 n=1 Tax=Cocos nucifera TaxID=13894 RepID=A0A8K0I843_COCNU|nr:myosin-11 [Cocos nucifera]
MSWLRSAVNKAVEVGGKNNLTRAVKSYADTVVQHAGQAVVGGAKIIQDRMGMRNYKSFKHTVKRLEEIAVTCRGEERVQLLRRWLVALKEIERLSAGSVDDKTSEQPMSSDEPNSSPRNASLILFFDSDMGGEPMNFRDVFLHSQALEGITLSMVKREELLQFAQGAISGLKVNAEQSRLDAEVSKLQKRIERVEALQAPSVEDHDRASSEKTSLPTVEVDKLKVLEESLANSCSKAEKRILDQRYCMIFYLQFAMSVTTLYMGPGVIDMGDKQMHQKEEALNFRVAKAKEVSEMEKELVAEIAGLEKQRDELEAALKKVNISLSATVARLKKTREERDQFDEASNQIVVHLKAKEDELSRSVASCKVEADIVHTWINFLEDTWQLQSSYAELKEKQTKYEELRPSINRIRTFVDNLKKFNESQGMTESTDSDISKESNPQKYLEEEYLEVETKIMTAFSVVDRMKELFYAGEGNATRKDDPEVKELFESVEKMRGEFESIERPILEVETPKEKLTPSEERSQKGPSHTTQTSNSPKSKVVESPKSTSNSKSKGLESPKSSLATSEHLDPESELAKLELEFGRVSKDYSTDEIGGWEFDELEQELSVVDRMKELFYAGEGNATRKDDPEVKELFESVEKMRGEFESIERPILEVETPKEKLTPSEERSQKGPSHTTQTSNSPKSKVVESPKSTSNSKSKGLESPKSSLATSEHLDPESELAKLELEFGRVSKDYSTDEIGGWEFDELEQELRISALE